MTVVVYYRRKECTTIIRRKYKRCHLWTISHMSNSRFGTSIRMQCSLISVHMFCLRTSTLSSVTAFLISTTHIHGHLRRWPCHSQSPEMFGEGSSMTIWLARRSCHTVWTANYITHFYERCCRNCCVWIQPPPGREYAIKTHREYSSHFFEHVHQVISVRRCAFKLQLVYANTLDVTFSGRWIGQGDPIAWPPRSTDLSCLDFFLWSHMESLIYSCPTKTAIDLVARIAVVAADNREMPGVRKCVSLPIPQVWNLHYN